MGTCSWLVKLLGVPCPGGRLLRGFSCRELKGAWRVAVSSWELTVGWTSSRVPALGGRPLRMVPVPISREHYEWLWKLLGAYN